MAEEKKKVVSKKTDAKQGKKNTRTLIITMCVLLAVIVVVIGGIYVVMNHYVHKMSYMEDDKVTKAESDVGASIAQEGLQENLNEATKENGETLSEKEKASIAEQMSKEAEEMSSQAALIPVASNSDVYNLLLIGVDVRAGDNWNGNSDSMILISINDKKKMIYMTSIMRDTYVNLEGYGASKLNRAHALGGGPFLVKTIEDNLRIHIDNYATVNFYSMIEIIDLLGGIPLTISPEEANAANEHIKWMCWNIGADPSGYYLAGGENIMVNGIQAVGFARVRQVGAADFGRTFRQRVVLTTMFNILKGSGIGTLNNFLNASLPKVLHNIPDDRLAALISNAPAYLDYGLDASLRVPFDGAYSSYQEMLVTDFAATHDRLMSIIY